MGVDGVAEAGCRSKEGADSGALGLVTVGLANNSLEVVGWGSMDDGTEAGS